jgi:hypothetical protein
MRRGLGLLGAVIVAVLAGVGAASALIATDGQDAVGPNMLHPDGRGSVIAASTADPVSGRDWAVRVYHTTEGQTCAEVGRSENGAFGQYDDAGKLQPLSVQGGGGCSDFSKSPVSVGVTRFAARDGHDARSVLSGLIDTNVEGLLLHTIAGERDLAIQHGAYIAVVEEAELGGGAVLEVKLHDGSTLSIPIGSSHLPAREAPPSDG